MNLTLIKNFFLSNERKSIEPAKVGRVFRRSFRVKRSKQILDSNREKRKSGKFLLIFTCHGISMQSSSITHSTSDESPNKTSQIFFLRFVCQQPRMDDFACSSRPSTWHRRQSQFRQVRAGASLPYSYMQEESPEGGRFKKEIQIDSQSYLLLIRDEGGAPEMQVSVGVCVHSCLEPYCLLFSQMSIDNRQKFAQQFSFFAVLRLGWRCNFRVLAGEWGELQRDLRLLHENVTLSKCRRDTHHSRGNSRWGWIMNEWVKVDRHFGVNCQFFLAI